jgi:preprotein translocase subunit SecF
MKPERIRWNRTKSRNQLLLDRVYDAVTEEFTRDAMASLATVLAHLCIVTGVAKPEAIEAFGNAYDEARDMLSGSGTNAALLN